MTQYLDNTRHCLSENIPPGI
ncbi:hypothetical protein ECEC1848_2407, partial [Escherichia coli EC1848]